MSTHTHQESHTIPACVIDLHHAFFHQSNNARKRTLQQNINENHHRDGKESPTLFPFVSPPISPDSPDRDPPPKTDSNLPK